jgi:hypothetical protein
VSKKALPKKSDGIKDAYSWAPEGTQSISPTVPATEARGGSQREWLQPILEEEGEGRPPMALRTEQTTMGRATDPKEQRRSAKRGRGHNSSRKEGV